MHRIAFAIATIFSLSIASPVLADGEIVITQAKVLAGNVTPGDTPGFPVHLYRPGAYVLESNLEVPAGKIGINAYANNIDIDMNGFTISGGGVASQGLRSIFGESRIHDGVINRFTGAGISLANNAWVIEDMQIVRNGGSGIDATDARYITVRKSIVAANSVDGIVAGANLSVQDSQISQNARTGISCRAACNVINSVVEANSGDGIIASNGFMIGNTIFNNHGYGVFDQSGTKDTGMANNMLANNNGSGTSQTSFTVDVHPNTCVGKPCTAP